VRRPLIEVALVHQSWCEGFVDVCCSWLGSSSGSSAASRLFSLGAWLFC